MNNSKKLKIWTLLTQAFIVAGAGHGVGPLLLFEVGGVIQPFYGHSGLDKFQQALLFFGFITLIGQVCLVVSIVNGAWLVRQVLYVIGVLLLLCATIYLGASFYFDRDSVLVYLTAVPFLICCFLTFIGKRAVGASQ